MWSERDCNVSSAIPLSVFLSVCPVCPVFVHTPSPDYWISPEPFSDPLCMTHVWTIDSGFLDFFSAPSLFLIPGNELYSVTTTTLWIALVIPVCSLPGPWEMTLLEIEPLPVNSDSIDKAFSKEFLLAFGSSNPDSRHLALVFFFSQVISRTISATDWPTVFTPDPEVKGRWETSSPNQLRAVI